MPVTLRELALAAGVSVTTASRALTGSDHAVSSEARARVMRAAAELGYQPNVSARTLRMDRSLTVGIMASDITSYFTPIIIRGIQDVLTDAGYFCVIASFGGDVRLQDQALDALISRGMDGVIFVESWQTSAVPRLQKAGKPYVFCERLFDSKIANSVVTDNYDGAWQATQHLIAAGHRRIAMLNGPDSYTAHERFQGYRDALESVGIDFDPHWVSSGAWYVQGGYSATQSLLAQTSTPDAIVVFNDVMAVGAIQALQDAGLGVPDDVAIVSYDDHPVATQFRPHLTTVTLPCFEMGQEAARLLLRQMDEEQTPTEELVLKGRLIVRDSCGTQGKT